VITSIFYSVFYEVVAISDPIKSTLAETTLFQNLDRQI
jgi:hypothetical protein